MTRYLEDRREGLRESMHYESREDGSVRCHVCSHHCFIQDGKRGVCGVRENDGGTLYALNYGKVSSMAVDPVEKKPLFNFHPGSRVMSFGTVGCCFRCDFCQNSRIAWAEPEDLPLRDQSPEEGVDEAEDRGCDSVAYTYNEPAIWLEHVLEGSREAQSRGLDSIAVTDGYFSDEALDDLIPHLSAANVDVKAFDEEFYKKVVSGNLEPVLETCERLADSDVHLEVTYLVIPDHNDDPEEIREFAEWVAGELGPEVPVHFSRFHPDHLMRDVPPTPIETLEMAHEIAEEAGLFYPYLGNVPGHSYEDTYCPGCGEKLVDRSGFTLNRLNVEEGACPACGRETDLVLG